MIGGPSFLAGLLQSAVPEGFVAGLTDLEGRRVAGGSPNGPAVATRVASPGGLPGTLTVWAASPLPGPGDATRRRFLLLIVAITVAMVGAGSRRARRVAARPWVNPSQILWRLTWRPALSASWLISALGHDRRFGVPPAIAVSPDGQYVALQLGSANPPVVTARLVLVATDGSGSRVLTGPYRMDNIPGGRLAWPPRSYGSDTCLTCMPIVLYISIV